MVELPFKQKVEQYSSRTLDGTLMYPGKWLCSYVLLWGAVWVQIGREALSAEKPSP